MNSGTEFSLRWDFEKVKDGSGLKVDASNAESRGEMTKKNSSIQVLRGVAVLLALLFHLGIFDAGFIGVDIFL